MFCYLFVCLFVFYKSVVVPTLKNGGKELSFLKTKSIDWLVLSPSAAYYFIPVHAAYLADVQYRQMHSECCHKK